MKKKQHIHTLTGILVLFKKQGNLAISDNLDAPGRYYDK
jgi:hypothetical protein